MASRKKTAPIGVPTLMIRRIAKTLGVDQAQSRAAIEAVLEDIRTNPCRIRNFGTFYIAERAAYKLTSPVDPNAVVKVPKRRRLALRSKSYPA